MTVIYVVRGSAGEYSDRNEWAICAYTDEALAQEHVRRASEAAATIIAIHRAAVRQQVALWNAGQNTEIDDPSSKLHNLYDPFMLAPSNDHLYWYDTVEVRDALPPEPTSEEQARIRGYLDGTGG